MYVQGPEEAYIADSYFEQHEGSAFGKEHKRSLIENDVVSQIEFPLRALGRAAALTSAPRPVVLRASGGRKGRFLSGLIWQRPDLAIALV